jgi:AcrR family transcriptional regulator
MSTTGTPSVPSRRERQREETRRDLAQIALDLATEHGVANVRVPQIAAAAGVSTRTFNNYFPSKEAAIAWPAMSRAGRVADNLREQPADETLGDAPIAAVEELYEQPSSAVSPMWEWMQKFCRLAGSEPALRVEYLKIWDAGERALAGAIAERTGAGEDELRPNVLAAMVVGAERAAVRHRLRHADRGESLAVTVRTALREALKGIDR